MKSRKDFMKMGSTKEISASYKEYLRHYYAGQALVGILTHNGFVTTETTVKCSAELADELIKALEI